MEPSPRLGVRKRVSEINKLMPCLLKWDNLSHFLAAPVLEFREEFSRYSPERQTPKTFRSFSMIGEVAPGFSLGQVELPSPHPARFSVQAAPLFPTPCSRA